MSECINCGATDDETGEITVGLLGDLNENVCTICRADELSQDTVLTRREAEVAAHKELTGASHGEIANRLGLTKSTVDEYSRRMKEKVRKAATTKNELSDFL